MKPCAPGHRPTEQPSPGEDVARHLVAAVLGAGTRLTGVTTLQAGEDRTVLRLTLAGSSRQLVLKLARAGARPAEDLVRTAAVSELARTAGVPVAEVLAVDPVPGESSWTYALQEHLDGVEWRTVRPLLDPDQVRAAQREIASALLAVQSVTFGAFGELNRDGAPAGQDLPTALRRRAELRVPDPRWLEVFSGLLERAGSQLVEHRPAPVLCHDDLHHGNVIFGVDGTGWRLAGFLDWEKAWAGPAESDVARMAFWDDMTGPGFWEVYRAAVPATDGEAERALVYQLLWCLEYGFHTPRARADTEALWRRLGLRSPESPAPAPADGLDDTGRGPQVR